MAEKMVVDNINDQNAEHHKLSSSNQDTNSLNLNFNDQRKNDSGSDKHHHNVEEFEYVEKESTTSSSPTWKSIVNDLVIIEQDELLHDGTHNIQTKSEDNHKNESTSEKTQYNRSISMHHSNLQQQPSNIQRTSSVPGNHQNDAQQSDNSNDNTTKVEKSAKQNLDSNNHNPISRLLQPTCEGIRERIELLGELLVSKRVDPIVDVYDEMTQIIEATERNERFKTGPDGERLLELTTAARSNLNVDLHNLDLEIQRQFGLYSVEVTGDGACAFRAILISGLQQPDVYHSELREKAIQQVLKDRSYYSTVLRPGDRVTEKELDDWIRSIDDPNTYGDEMANIAIADRYHIQLVIFRAGELLTVVNPRDGFVQNTAFLVNVGTHYKALVSRSELDQARQNSERLCK